MGEPVSSKPPRNGLVTVARKGFYFGFDFKVLAEGRPSSFVVPVIGRLTTFTRAGLIVASLMSCDCKKSLRISFSLCLFDIC